MPLSVWKRLLALAFDTVEALVEITPTEIDDIAVGAALDGLRRLLKIEEE